MEMLFTLKSKCSFTKTFPINHSVPKPLPLVMDKKKAKWKADVASSRIKQNGTKVDDISSQ